MNEIARIDRLCMMLIIALICTLQMGHAFAAVDPVDFSEHPELEHRYRNMTEILRCPKCQNQSIAGSDAPIAKDMRKKVEQLLKKGHTDAEIEQFMIDRYGDYVTYNPPLKGRTYILWFGPPLFLLLIAFGFWLSFGRRGSSQDLHTDDEIQKEKEDSPLETKEIK